MRKITEGYGTIGNVLESRRNISSSINKASHLFVYGIHKLNVRNNPENIIKVKSWKGSKESGAEVSATSSRWDMEIIFQMQALTYVRMLVALSRED